MEEKEKLEKLYKECIEELKTINIDIRNNDLIGLIDINISKRNSKRYGCCKQENPDQNYYHIIKRKNRKVKVYDRFNKHHIEISKWLMELNEDIIKNTIMHEIIHCFPKCNNHGIEFKKYANYINQKLKYNITTYGNKKDDYEKSNIEFKEETNNYKYKIVCNGCNQTFLRQRLKKNFAKIYKCGKCGGELIVIYIEKH